MLSRRRPRRSPPPRTVVAAERAPAPQPVVAAQPEPTPLLNTRVARIVGPLALASGAMFGTLAFTSASAPAPITLDEIIAAQRNWGDAIVRISKTYRAHLEDPSRDGGDYVAEAEKAADQLYGYGRTDVLFKPTKNETPFRPTAKGALVFHWRRQGDDGRLC